MRGFGLRRASCDKCLKSPIVISWAWRNLFPSVSTSSFTPPYVGAGGCVLVFPVFTASLPYGGLPLSTTLAYMQTYCHSLQIWTYNENAPQKAANSVRPQAPVGQAQSPGAQAPSAGAHSAVGQVQHATMQQAQPLVPVGPVAPGQPRPVVGTAVPLGAAVGQTAQPRPQAVRPGQAMSLQPVVGAQQYPGAYATAAVGQRPAYPYPQYMQPGMVRPSHPLAPQFTEAQRKKAEEERQAKDEQKRREIEEKRQRIQEENARKAQQKREREEAQRQKKQQLQAERDRKAEIRREDKRRKDEEKLRKKEERERQRLERQSKGRKRPVANKNAGSGGSMVPLPADDGQVAAPGSVQGKKRPPARKAGMKHMLHICLLWLCYPVVSKWFCRCGSEEA